jgi:CO/xanthine dehydrogenase Mo-binding subunit
MPGMTGSQLGLRRPRTDGRAKVTGTTRYAGDLPVPGLLHARIVPSIYAHARIRGIDRSAALGVPGVVAVLAAGDLPVAGVGPQRRFEPLAIDEVVYAGQPVALVVAETEEVAEDAAALVHIDEEPLPPVVDLLAALEPGAPPARVHVREGAESPPAFEADDPSAERFSGNVLGRSRDQRGDPDESFAACDVVVEGSFRTPWAYQAYMEPHVAIAWVEPDGTLAVTASTQALFTTRNNLAAVFGLPTAKVRVTAAPIGGGFGSKQTVIEPLVAGAALALRAPVRLVLTRQEDFASTKPAQATVAELRIGATSDGRLLGLQARVVYDTGAYPESSMHTYSAPLVTGPYRWSAYDVEAIGVRTNRFAVGNYRAPTGPQLTHALETLVDEIAVRLNIDPVDLRLANLVAEGDPTASGETWPRIAAAECLDEMRSHRIWTERTGLPAGEGIGLALGVWEGTMEPSAATCRLEPDGTLTVITGVVDISGVNGGFEAIAAEAFGVAREAVTITTADTATAPPAPGSSGSAITYGAGLAVQQAAVDARDQFLRLAAELFEIKPDDLELVDGRVQPRGAPDVARTVADIAGELSEGWSAPVEGHASTAHKVVAPSVAGHLAHVRVDVETGRVDLLDYAVIQDVGRALDPSLVEDQMLGAAVQSIGRATHEVLIHDEHGQLLTGTFLDYAIPRAAQMPPIDTVIVEVPAPEGPFGAKGIGEASMLAGPAAIANAIAAAAGVRLQDLPITANRVWAALRERATQAIQVVRD